MNDLFNSLKNSNLIIILAVITAIVLALIIIIIIEKIDKNKRKNDIEYYQEDFDVEEEYEDEIVYVDEEPTEEEAKKTLEEMQKKLVEEDDDGLIKHTHFEIEQEEKSIISYEELKKAAEYVDETNDQLLEDEGTEPITIEELYKRHVENNDKEQLENPIYEEEQKEETIIKEEPKKEINNEKKFKNSEVISPVFGIYKQEAAAYRKVAPIQRQETKQELNDIELEIEKTEAFLEELKNLKSKLR